MYSSRTLRILDNAKSGICEGENLDRDTSDIILDKVELSINSLDSIDQPTQMNEPDLSELLDTGTSDVCTINWFSEVIETDTRLVVSANIQESSSTHTSSDIAEHQNQQLGCDELHSSFSEDSDDSMKDAEFVASSTSSTSSSCSGCSECSNSEAENINPNLTRENPGDQDDTQDSQAPQHDVIEPEDQPVIQKSPVSQLEASASSMSDEAQLATMGCVEQFQNFIRNEISRTGKPHTSTSADVTETADDLNLLIRESVIGRNTPEVNAIEEQHHAKLRKNSLKNSEKQCKRKILEERSDYSNVEDFELQVRSESHGKLQIVLQMLAETQLILNHIQGGFEQVPVQDPSQPLHEVMKCIPIDSADKLQSLELELNDPTSKNFLMLCMKKAGGTNGREFVVRNLRKIFVDSFASKTSWCGQRNNIRINNLKLIKLLQDVAQTPYLN
ncbi:hypothetical protein RN001_011253 [Aquatica leii]|uniref:DUF4806 domain-containing protein n=1 Tax=Aquatica leii TaxID=1421715 RepID=A0AAN7SEX5_9COLE|nr:hypothetical protein RN001_011253 [Aquatica leii]